MLSRASALIALISAAAFFVDSADCYIPRNRFGAWIPVNWTDLPQAAPEDQILVQYLVAPLLEADLGNLLADFHLYHGAVGFTNMKTGFSVTVNYDADDIFRSCLFPEIVTLANGTRDLVWINEGSNFVYLGINETYWTQYHHVGTINGTGYNAFFSGYNAQVNLSHPYYAQFTVQDHWNGTVYLPSFDCFDFAWEAMQHLADLGMQINSSIKTLNRDVCSWYTKTVPIKVTVLYEHDPIYRERIVHFYELIQANVKDLGLLELILTIIEVADGEFFYRAGPDYYLMELHWPILGMDWIPSTLPQPSSAGSHPLFLDEPNGNVRPITIN